MLIENKINNYLNEIWATNIRSEVSSNFDFQFNCYIDNYPTEICKNSGSSVILIRTTFNIGILKPLFDFDNSFIETDYYFTSIKTVAKGIAEKYSIYYENNLDVDNTIVFKDRIFIEGETFNINEFDRKISNIISCVSTFTSFIANFAKDIFDKGTKAEYLDYFS